MPSDKIIQLRQLLTDKFPGSRLRLGASDRLPTHFRSKGETELETLFERRFAKGSLNELVAPRGTAGSATFMRAFIGWAARQERFMGLIDGADGFDVTGLNRAEIARLLWVRCANAEMAMKAADLLLRDGNLPLIFLDLKGNSEQELRHISPTTWYRLQRLAENGTSICLVLTPFRIVMPAQVRITIRSDFQLGSLVQDTEQLLLNLRWDASDNGRRDAISNIA